jgi:hypothetical protein
VRSNDPDILSAESSEGRYNERLTREATETVQIQRFAMITMDRKTLQTSKDGQLHLKSIKIQVSIEDDLSRRILSFEEEQTVELSIRVYPDDFGKEWLNDGIEALCDDRILAESLLSFVVCSRVESIRDK